MNLDHVQAELRPRLPWEAADFGIALGRRYAPALLREWFSTAWLPWLLAVALLFIAPLWAWLPLWWLKPMMSVRPAFFLSRQLFGIVPPRGAARQALFTWLAKRAWADLTFARFRRRRGILQIVRTLEGARAPKERLKLFHQTTPSWLIKGCLLVEFGLYAGLIILVFWFGPESWVPWSEESGGFDGFIDNLANNDLDPVAGFRFGVISTLAYGIASMVSELAYTASCFGCYLNTRTELEGWDLEIAFKRLAARAATFFAPTALAFFLTAGALLMPSAQARETAPPEETPEQIAGRITADPDFIIHKETKRKWRQNQRSGTSVDLSWLNLLVYPLAVLVILAVVAGLVWILVRSAGMMRDGVPPPDSPKAVAGLDVRPESLPADPLGTARSWWAEGRHREALSLLYRAALSWLIHQGGVEIEAGDTEGECTRRVAATPGTAALSAYFQQLTRAWLGIAYAQSPPSAATWDALCAAWPFRNPVKPGNTSAAGLAVLALACGLLTGCGGRFEDSEETKGYRGKARYDPYLAVSRLNAEIGGGARTSFSLLKDLAEQEEPGGTQWVLTPSLLVNERTAGKLLDHVAGGDHLILALSELDHYEEMGLAPPRWIKDKKPVAEDEEERRERWRKRQLDESEGEEGFIPGFPGKKDTASQSTGGRLRKLLEKHAPGAAMIMESANVGFADEVDESAPDLAEGEDFASSDWDWPAAFVFADDSDDPSSQRTLTVEYGDGWITFVPSMRPFTNIRLANASNASLWHSLVDWHGGEVCFVRGSGASFFAVLWEYGWRALVAGMLALALWLWAVTKRYGRLPPLRVPPPLDAKAGLIATGGFLVRKNQVPALLAPWAESLYARWRRNQPAEPEPTHARFLAEVAPAAGLSAEEAADCFSPSGRIRPRNFIVLAQRLWRLERAF
jgi:hypothetical protein